LNQAPMMNAIWKQVVEEKTKHRDWIILFENTNSSFESVPDKRKREDNDFPEFKLINGKEKITFD
jgi:hypothetical protein